MREKTDMPSTNGTMEGGRTRRSLLKAVGAGAAGVWGVGSLAGNSFARQELPNTVTIESTGGRVRYEVTVDGTIEKGPEADSGDRIFDENTARGLIGSSGTDSFRFSGAITAFDADGSVAVSVNGERVDDPVGQPGSDGDGSARVASNGVVQTEQVAVIEQGGNCIPVAPLSFEGMSVTDFYGYTEDEDADVPPFESNTPGNIGRPDTSYVFLYQEPDGPLSLVFIQGGGGKGGAATFDVRGLPDGEWVVRDDDYERDPDQWRVGGDRTVVHWSWNRFHNDGGAYEGLGDDFEIEIRPAFNDAAELEPSAGYVNSEPGDITNWRVLSMITEDRTAGPEGREGTELALDEPIVIRSGTC